MNIHRRTFKIALKKLRIRRFKNLWITVTSQQIALFPLATKFSEKKATVFKALFYFLKTHVF